MTSSLPFSCELQVSATLLADSRPFSRLHAAVIPGLSSIGLSVGDALWQINAITDETANGVFDMRFDFRLTSGRVRECSVGFSLHFPEWSQEHYVLLPAAAYNGNRFEVRKLPYAPMLSDPADLRADAPIFITDVPRLNNIDGRSRIQLLTRDLSTPAAGYFDPGKLRGFWMLTEQGTERGDSAIEVEERDDRFQAAIRVSAPGVRHPGRYTICNTNSPSDDRGADFSAGDAVTLRARLYFFDCPDLQGLFDRFFEIRQDLSGPIPPHPVLPFSSAWEIQERKYNEQNWEDEYGYYSVGMRENLHQDWQIGWVGGLMATYPLLFQGSPVSRSRALRNFDFVFPRGQDKSGFFHGCGHKGEWYGDNFHNTRLRWHLIRKSADALYYILKQFMLLTRSDPDFRLPKGWLEGTKACADAFVKLWNRYGQFGQFVNSETGEIIVGGSASAAVAPAGLALAGKFFSEPEYDRVAKQSAEFYYRNFVKRGYTTGGPGEILQCPDSESAFGLLESFIVLFEVTGERRWIGMAGEQARQCATWCVSYDFHFPPESTFGKLGMKTGGTVYANVQNKHSAPGICTLSGSSLLKLFRATGDLSYLELIRQIAHSLPQYLSREDRPIEGLRRIPGGSQHDNDMELVPMPAGWMNERVEMSDWWEPVGEIFYGSCWCEVSAMMTYVEVPGLYVQPDTGLVCAIDHITVEEVRCSGGKLEVWLHNPTSFDAVVKVLSEPSTRTAIPLGQNALWACPTIRVGAGERRMCHFP